MQAEYLKLRFEIKDDLHRLISGIEFSLENVAKMNEDMLKHFDELPEGSTTKSCSSRK